MANKRILQFDTAEQLEDDDYLLIDHQDEGTRKILASQVGGGGGSNITLEEELLYNNPNGSQAVGQWQLAHLIDDYDFLAIRYGLWDDYINNALCEIKLVSVSDLNAMYTEGKRVILTGYGERVCYVKFHENMMYEEQSVGYQLVLQVSGIKITGSAGGSSSGGSDSEVIPISAGDGTTSRTFAFTKTPKFIKFYWKDPYVDLGWYYDATLVWGQDWMAYQAYYLQTAVQENHGGTANISYDGNRITITGGNAFGAMNSTDGSGYMYVDYGGGSGEGDDDDITNMTWNLLINTEYSSGTGVNTEPIGIPTGTKYLVILATMNIQNAGTIYVDKVKLSEVNKIMQVTNTTSCAVGFDWDDTTGNHTYASILINKEPNTVKAHSGYGQAKTLIYALY